jgi:hypothetical protein
MLKSLLNRKAVTSESIVPLHMSSKTLIVIADRWAWRKMHYGGLYFMRILARAAHFDIGPTFIDLERANVFMIGPNKAGHEAGLAVALP